MLHRPVEPAVKSGQTIAGRNPPLSAVTPKADKRGYGGIVRFVPRATKTASDRGARYFPGAKLIGG